MANKRKVILVVIILGLIVFFMKDVFIKEKEREVTMNEKEITFLLGYVEENGEKVDFNLDIGDFSIYKVSSGTIPEFHKWYAIKNREVIQITKTQDLSKVVQGIRNEDEALYLIRYASSWVKQADGVLIVYDISDDEAKRKLSDKEYSEFKALNLKGTAIRKDWRGNYIIERDVWAFPYKYDKKAPYQLVRIREVVTPQGDYEVKLIGKISKADWIEKFLDVIM